MRAACCVALLVLGASCAAPVCDEPVDGHPEQRKCSDGAIERVASTSCAPTTCSFEPNPSGGGPCSEDFNCITEDNKSEGFCVQSNCVCDECLVDTDCDARALCACTLRESVGAGCVFGCRTSADCHDDERCVEVDDGPTFACQALDTGCHTTHDCWWPGDRCTPSDDKRTSSWICTSKVPEPISF